MTSTQFLPRCPTCDQTVKPTADSKFLPFCCQRCQLIDLGRWLSEENSVPVDRHDEDEEEEAETSARPKLPPGWHDA